MKYSSADDINFHSQLPFNVASDEIFIFFLARDSIRQWDDAISEELTVAVCRPAGNVKLFDFHFIFKKVQCQRTEKMENKYEMDRFGVVVLLSFIHSGMSSSIVAFSSFYSKIFFCAWNCFACACMEEELSTVPLKFSDKTTKRNSFLGEIKLWNSVHIEFIYLLVN